MDDVIWESHDHIWVGRGGACSRLVCSTHFKLQTNKKHETIRKQKSEKRNGKTREKRRGGRGERVGSPTTDRRRAVKGE